MQAATTVTRPDVTNAGAFAQFLTFVCAGEEYGVAILCVQEIKGWEGVTRVPHAASYLLGVMNLRGVIVPVIDLRLRFGMPEAERDVFTVIIVANVNGRLAGIVVDAVSDVINVGDAHLCAAPEYEGQENREFIRGLAQVDGKLLVLLDVDRLVNPDSLEKSAAAATATAAK
jgi:purine-binding chemotaxis protein CheW